MDDRDLALDYTFQGLEGIEMSSRPLCTVFVASAVLSLDSIIFLSSTNLSMLRYIIRGTWIKWSTDLPYPVHYSQLVAITTKVAVTKKTPLHSSVGNIGTILTFRHAPAPFVILSSFNQIMAARAACTCKKRHNGKCRRPYSE